jgi:glycosyltransferase involved in cell wall biosynthesis
MEQSTAMRIALIVTGGVDRSGRARVIPALLSLIERLARGNHVVVYALRYLDAPCSYALLGATVHDLGSPRGVARQFTATVRALRRDGPFDVIHGYWALPAGLVAAAAGRLVRAPSVVTLDSGELVGVSQIGYGLQLRPRHRLAVAATLRLARKLTVTSAYMDRLARSHGAAPEIVPLGVDTALFIPPLAGRPEGPPWRLIHVANLNVVKDQRTLLDAFARIRQRVDDVHLDIVGEDTMAGAVQRYARDRDLDMHVTFHGSLPTDALIPLYQRSHLAILSSRHEAAGVVVLEAAACGVPTVGTTVGYIADWTPDRAVGVPVNDAAALADAVVALLDDPARRTRLATAARAWVLEHDADWTAHEIQRVYREAQSA